VDARIIIRKKTVLSTLLGEAGWRAKTFFWGILSGWNCRNKNSTDHELKKIWAHDPIEVLEGR
jgi:hypothetical protein